MFSKLTPLILRSETVHCGDHTHSAAVFIRSLYLVFVFSEFCLVPSVGVPPTSTSALRLVDYKHGVPYLCNSHKGRSTFRLEVFHVVNGTPTYYPENECPSPVAIMAFPELSQDAQGPESRLLSAPERGVRRRLRVMKNSTPGTCSNSQVPPLTTEARTHNFRRPKGAGASKETGNLVHSKFRKQSRFRPLLAPPIMKSN